MSALSLNQASSFLAERAGRATDQVFIDMMKDLVVFKRARFLANSFSKNPSLDKYYLQSFNIDLTKVSREDECEDVEGLKNCEVVYKTDKKIPQPVKYGVNLFAYVGGLGGTDSFGWTTFASEEYLKHSKITGKSARYTFLNEYIYVLNKAIDKIRVEGVFSDPRLLKEFKCVKEGDTSACYSDDFEFPIDEQTMEIIIKDILATELRLLPDNEKLNIKQDKSV